MNDGTRARNRAFQERLDEIWRETANWDSKLKIEAKDAVETILNMKDSYQNHINNFRFSIKQEINSIFDKIDNEIIPSESRRVDIIENDLTVFIKETVPDRIEKQSGEVSRQLRRAYETFDIEKKKEEKRYFFFFFLSTLKEIIVIYIFREKKIVNRAEKHIQKTSQRFEDEDAFLSSCFFNLEDEIVQHERRAARMHLINNEKAIQNTVDLYNISEKEAQIRETEDILVLDTVIDTQKILQQTVLMHFGSKADEIDFNDFPITEKLNQRMNQINDRKQKETNEAEEASHEMKDELASIGKNSVKDDVSVASSIKEPVAPVNTKAKKK